MAMTQLGSKTVGSIVKLKENGSLVEFYVAKHDYESGLNGSGRTLLVRKDCYDQRAWHSSDVNAYASSDIDAWLNSTYKNLLPAEIRTAMGTTKFYYTPGSKNRTVTTLARAVFLLSGTEFGQGYNAINVEGSALPIADTIKIAKFNGSIVDQWTRSPGITGSTAFCVLINGLISSNSCTVAYGSRPAFTLPATCFVNSDGSVSVNTAPATPSSISVPASIDGGSTITVNWGAAADAEGNLEGYKVERSTDGGSTWAQIYQGNGRSTVNTVQFGTGSVMYRVRAYDSGGLASGWRTSGQVAVINNTAPAVPSGITVPDEVAGGQPLTITWGASTDGENNLAGYSLERQVDGGSWKAVYTGKELGFTDSITKGWKTVAYRVRAYDSASAYSGFAVSQTREVNNNTPPTITCVHSANAALGVKNEGFAVAYSVTDEEGDAVTVTEAIDGVTARTFPAVAGRENSFQVTGETFMKLLNGPHTLTITASDGRSGTTRRLTFSKLVTAASVTLEQPMPADGPISACVLSVNGFIPVDAEYTVEVTNNAMDEAPVWENCTAAVRAGVNHAFANETAVNGFAFSFRLSVKRGPSGVGGCITSVQGGFQ